MGNLHIEFHNDRTIPGICRQLSAISQQLRQLLLNSVLSRHFQHEPKAYAKFDRKPKSVEGFGLCAHHLSVRTCSFISIEEEEDTVFTSVYAQ